ncbi:MAG: hypothetical protein JM58_11475 [Peptococcaceae bacterium BICA1-8]|nr:MAG: hypothetical protein JM58_11475 [Peptococcaceae bacterium BICA1-8]
MQLKDFHIGWAQSVKSPNIYCGEAYLLWDNLVARYDIIHVSQIYLNAVHDEEFKLIMKKGLMDILEKQVNILEKEMDKYHLALPDRPPISVRFKLEGNIINDEYVFRKLFTGIQSFIDNLIRTVKTMVYNDDLRKIFLGFLKDELEAYDDICNYGKMKDWLRNPPLVLRSEG